MSEVSPSERVDAPSPAQLRALIDQASDGIFVADSSGRYTFVNEAGCRLLGYARDEIVGRTIFDLIPAEDVQRLLDSKAQMLQQRVHIAEWRLRRKDGSWLPVEVSAKILPDGQWQGIVRDISERKAHEARNAALLRELESERHWLHTALDALPVGVVLYRRGESNFYNRRCEELFGMKLSPSAGSAQYASRMFLPNGAPVPPSELPSTRVMRDQATIRGAEYVIERPDGSRIHVLGDAAPVRGSGDQMIGGVGVFQDITELHETQEKERAGEQLLRAVFDLLPVGLWIADRAGRIVLANRAGEEIWQGTRYVGPAQFGEYKGWWLESGEPIAPEDWGVARAIRLGETSRGELIRIQCFDGSFKTVINWAAPIRSEAGEITAAIALNEDVTSLQHTQEQLRAAVGEREHILAVVAHDLRNPLAGIIYAAHTMQGEAAALAGGEHIRATAQDVIETAQRMSGLVDDLLAVSVAQPGRSLLRVSPTAPSTLARKAAEAARPALSKRAIQLELRIADRIPILNIDGDRIMRVLGNLLDNASKFTTRNGRIELGVGELAGGVRFTVSNSGEPLPPETLKAMFEPFWQAGRGDRRGAGLGLAICRAIVEAHGGTIWAEPARGQRVRVCFVLPRTAAAPAS
jgi:PAS domain S-box-containing protein